MHKHPDATFGPDNTPANYAAIALTVAKLEPRSLTVDQLPDVITIVEYMRDECVAAHHANEDRASELNAREESLVKRERELEIRRRAVELMLKGRDISSGRWFKRA